MNNMVAGTTPHNTYGATTRNCVSLGTPVPADTIKIASEYRQVWLPSATPDITAPITSDGFTPMETAIGKKIGNAITISVQNYAAKNVIQETERNAVAGRRPAGTA